MRTFAPMMKTNTLDAMNHLYNAFLQVGKCALDLIASLPRSCPPHGKLRKLASGQQEVWRQLRRELVGGTDQRPVMWLHAASLGEYGVARPIARALHAQGRWRIVVTFFSPTGYEALKGKYAEEADHVFYLPLDTRAQACAFLDLVRPAKALFIISEFWPNYLAELKRRAVPTFLVSALISPKAPFFRWYGGVFRRALEAFTHFAVLNEASATRLGSLGHTNVTVTGDPLFDEALADVLERLRTSKDFSNARSVRKLVDHAVIEASWAHDEAVITEKDLLVALPQCVSSSTRRPAGF